MLYDLRNYDKEPFSVFTISDDSYLSTFSFPPRVPQFSKLEFSNDGKSVLVGTSGGVHYVLDAFDGRIKARLVGFGGVEVEGLSSGGVCFTPDGQYVIGGMLPRRECLFQGVRRKRSWCGIYCKRAEISPLSQCINSTPAALARRTS
jgi:COMPASS component SWD2